MNRVVLSHIDKTFFPGGVRADRDASLSLEKGEIHAIVGENGAGKTTLMRILAGLEKPDSGRIEIDGRAVAFASPSAAQHEGIGMVHQHFTTIPGFTAAENMLFGMEPKRFGLVDRRRLRIEAGKLAALHGFRIDIDALAEDLSVGARQQIEILRLLARDCGLLIFDEPTSVLADEESESLFRTLREFARSGKTIALVTHKVQDVLQVADRVTVMRSGSTIGTYPVGGMSPSSLSALMVGEGEARSDERSGSKRSGGPRSPVLVVESLSADAPGHRREKLHDISFNVGEGEILGICGVADGGLKELEETLSGEVAPAAGRVLLGGGKLPEFRDAPWAAGGFAYIPSDRLGRGICPGRLVWEHFVALDRKTFFAPGTLDKGKARAQARTALEGFGLADAVDRRVDELSGGMIQRSILARELSDPAPRYCLACEPSWGLDTSTTRKAWDGLLRLRESGTAVVLISTNLDEILALSDRIAVLRAGRIAAIIPNSPETDRRRIGELMLGTRARIDPDGAASEASLA